MGMPVLGEKVWQLGICRETKKIKMNWVRIITLHKVCLQRINVALAAFTLSRCYGCIGYMHNMQVPVRRKTLKAEI